ncbi:MAG TPA: preprotein translocase subunit SecE [Aggregatilineales bacterium]|nr:preprotein translocase subunit SecE [Anaerolineales bacterium]HRE48607.1 preprotein translocase subunit SecE [Aggregatilineales bacterium]
MSPVSTKRAGADQEESYSEEELAAEAEAAAALDSAAAPAVSDSRRRRQAKRGIVTPEPAPAPVRKDRPTPSQRDRDEVVVSRNFIIRFVQNLRTYFRETLVELRKVAWPSREEVRRLTSIVLVVTIVSALFLGFVSFIFGFLTTQMATLDTAIFAGALGIALVIIVGGLWLVRDRLFKPLD